MARLMKKIKVVRTDAKNKRIEDEVFRSYKAVAMKLSVGERVIVSVIEYLSGEKDPLEIFAGYGEVERTKTGWIEPRRLMLEY